MMFLNEVKELYAEEPRCAWERAQRMCDKYIDNPILQQLPSLWKESELLETFHRRMARLEDKVKENAKVAANMSGRQLPVTSLKVCGCHMLFAYTFDACMGHRSFVASLMSFSSFLLSCKR